MSPQIINPEQLSDNDIKLLIAFFQNAKDSQLMWHKNTTYTIASSGCELQFMHNVIARTRKTDQNQTDQGIRFEFWDPDAPEALLGKGAFGAAYEIAGTLAIKDNTVTYKKAGMHKNKTRVVKIQESTSDTDEDQQHLYDFTINEYYLSEQSKHLAIKSPTLIYENHSLSSYSVMRKLPGESLLEIQSTNLTIIQRLSLTKALLSALQNQVSNCDIIHMDIKPENILVDLREPMQVNIIDYGLSERAQMNKSRNATGTIMYVAPEVWLCEEHTKKIDVFSMARVIAELWNINPETWGHDRPAMKTKSQEQPDLSTLFTGIADNICSNNKQIIATMLTNMLQPHVDARYSIEDAILDVEKINMKLEIDEHRHCHQLQTILRDYNTHLHSKILQKKLNDKINDLNKPINQKLRARYMVMYDAYEQIKHKKVLNDDDKVMLKKAIQTCLKNKPSWLERSFLTKLLDILSFGLKPLYRMFRSKEPKFQEQLKNNTINFK